MRLLAISLAALFFACVATSMAAEIRPDETQQLVAVDGARRLFLDCMGRGEPTVVLDAGYSSVSANWRPAQEMLAPHNRVCAYDRAGMAHSDGPSRPTTPANVIDDLHRLIRAAHIKTPIVLVGHSRGGLYATLYALTYRSDVAAMVLVDPAFVQYEAEKRAVSASQREFMASNKGKGRENLVRCEALAKARALTEADPRGCFSVSASDPPAYRDAWLYQGVRPAFYRALISEADAADADVDTAKIIEAEKASKHPLGDLPLVVLTSDKFMQTNAPNPSDNIAVDRVWKRGHERLAGYSSVGRSRVVPKTSHMVQVDDPRAVVDAVNTVLADCCRGRR